MIRESLERIRLRTPPRSSVSADERRILEGVGCWPIEADLAVLLFDFGGSRPAYGEQVVVCNEYIVEDILSFGVTNGRSVVRVLSDLASSIPQGYVPWSRDGLGNYLLSTPDGSSTAVYLHDQRVCFRVMPMSVGEVINTAASSEYE
jgi:hypothetical protein